MGCIVALLRILVALVVIALVVGFLVFFASFALPIVIGGVALLILFKMVMFAFGGKK